MSAGLPNLKNEFPYYLPKISLLIDIFSLLKHKLVTENFSQFPYFVENWPKLSLLGTKNPYRIKKVPYYLVTLRLQNGSHFVQGKMS